MKLRYTLPALADLNSILDYIAEHSPQGARRVQTRIHAAVGLLVRRTSDPTVRCLTTTPYPFVIFYQATQTEIIIHAVRHAARNPSGMPGSS